MEKLSIKKMIFKRFLHRNEHMDIKGSDAIYLILCTLVEIGFPIYFLLSDYKMKFPYNALVLIGTIFVLFFIFVDLKMFFQKNYFDLLTFQFRTYMVCMLIALIVFGVKRWEIVGIVDLADNSTIIWVVISILYLIFLVGSFLCVAVSDLILVLLLRFLALIFKIDMHNPYMEKLQFAQSIEGSEEFTRLRIRSQYENRFQESRIDAIAFGQYCNEQHKNEQCNGDMNLEMENYLFEHTKHFKKITSFNQVESRYEMLMKIYLPQNESADLPDICREIQEEYQDIKNKKEK